jgi:hypothetical protein
MLDVQVDTVKKTITIVLPLEEPRPSSTGKTLLVGGTNGAQKTTALVNGKQVVLTASAYIKP